MDLEIEGKRLTLVNVYGPNEDSPEFFITLAEKIEECENDSCIICGDFNLVQDQNLDTFNYVNINNPRAKDCVLSLKEELNLTDPFRELYEQTKRYTWRKPTPFKQARLDFFLISESLMSSVQNVEILPSYRSDHSTVVLSFQANDFKKGSGLWKFNNSLLKDVDYVKTIKDCVHRIKEQYMIPIYSLEYVHSNNCNDVKYTISDQLLLETLLMEIRGKTISFSAYKKKQNMQREQSLQNEILELEKTPEINCTQIEVKKKELQNIRKEKIQGIMVRARVKWAEEGEKPTKYFCSLESRNYINKTIFKIMKDDGRVVNKQEEILKETKLFYEELYNDKDLESDTNIEDTLNNINECSKLSEEDNCNLEGEITSEEILLVLKKMKNNKSPGADGFTTEFF